MYRKTPICLSAMWITLQRVIHGEHPQGDLRLNNASVFMQTPSWDLCKVAQLSYVNGCIQMY